MKRNSGIIILLLLTITATAQNPLHVSRLLKVLQEQHVSPPVLNDSLSIRLFQNFISSLDPEKKLLLESEINQLTSFETKLDDELANSTLSFLRQVIPMYKASLERSLNILQKPIMFNWLSVDQFIDGSAAPFPKNEMAHQIRWQQFLQAEVLAIAWSQALQDSVAFDLAYLNSRERDILTRIVKVETQNISRILKHPMGFENYVESLYLKSIAATYDPHTTLISGNEYRYFQESLSTLAYTFGIVIEETVGGNIRIEQVVPGGAAWQTGRIHAGDILVEIRNNKSQIYTFVGVGIDHASALLDEIPVEVVNFTIRKSDGTTISVPLKKQKSENESNIVSSFILQQHNKRVGYISLPGFYTTESSEEGSECANDVAKEIIKLKRDGIEGLVLDLRFNGGGSLKEAIALAGIFIHEGPILMTQMRDRITTLKDFNRGTVYDGPLLVLVNHQSASASEVVAAALQDYNRAIIVGSTTFGKSTGQRILPLDPLPANPQAAAKAIAEGKISFVKITQSKLLRVTGLTHQAIGVIPDLLLPDLFDGLNLGEQALQGSLKVTPVEQRLPIVQYPQLPVTKLETLSKSRISGNKRFQQIIMFNQWLIRKVKQTSTSLNINEFNRLMDQEQQLFVKGQNYTKNTFTITTKSFDRNRETMDEFYKLSNENFMRKLETDVALEEAFFILCDYINLLNK